MTDTALNHPGLKLLGENPDIQLAYGACPDWDRPSGRFLTYQRCVTPEGFGYNIPIAPYVPVPRYYIPPPYYYHPPRHYYHRPEPPHRHPEPPRRPHGRHGELEQQGDAPALVSAPSEMTQAVLALQEAGVTPAAMARPSALVAGVGRAADGADRVKLS